MISEDVQALAELKGLSRWVWWRQEARHGGKRTKVPYGPQGRAAKANDPATWGTCDQAAAAAKRAGCKGGSEGGLGIQLGDLGNGRHLVGIDLDACRHPQDGDLAPWAKDIVDQLRTYTEVSPSGTGVKLFGLVAELPPALRSKGMEVTVDAPLPAGAKASGHSVPEIGIYPTARYFAVTGHHLEGTPDTLELIDEPLAELASKLGRLRDTRRPYGGAPVELPSRLRDALASDKDLRHAWDDGTKLGRGRDDSRSGKDFALAARLRLRGFGDAEIAEALQLFPHGQTGSGALTGAALDRRIERILKDLPSRTSGNGAKPNGHAASSVGDGEPEDKKGPSARDKLISIADEEVELWPDMDGGLYATVRNGDHKENYPLGSSAFRRWLVGRYGDRFKVLIDGQERRSAPSAGALSEAMLAMEAQAARGRVHMPAVRVAGDFEAIYVDLGRPDWGAVEITRDGWQIVGEPPLKLIRPHGSRPLPLPEGGGSMQPLQELIGIPDDAGEEGDAWRLICGWLAGCLAPRGPYPLLLISGEQGSGKSTVASWCKRLVDPGLADRRAIPKDVRDLVIAAKASRVISFDNLSKIDPEMSDAIARISTGAALGARALYSNDEEHLISVCAPIVANGIPDLASRADLADRAVTIKLSARPDDQRRSEAELQRAFDYEWPGLFGALLDAAVQAMANRDDVEELLRGRPAPRMLDFAIWAEAAAPSFGWPRWTWLEAYERNRGDTALVALESDPIAGAIRALLDPKLPSEDWRERLGFLHSRFHGNATNLLKILDGMVEDRVRKDRGWPKDGQRLAGRLRRAAPNLRRMGVQIEEFREGKSGSRCWRIEQVSKGL